MTRWYNRNLGIDPQDPEYDRDYDEEEDYNAYLDAIEAKADFERENYD